MADPRAALLALLLAGCAGRVPAIPSERGATAGAPIEVGIVAVNDFHGNLEPPKLSITAIDARGAAVQVPAGGAAWLAATIASLRARHPDSIAVSAGDLTGASPLVSSVFLDEPTVAAMNLAGLDLNAAGNHEFDRGVPELMRLQQGGCTKTTLRAPCMVEPFEGARFGYLAANTQRADGTPVLPPTALRRFGTGARQVTIGFIGVTTRTTNRLVAPGQVPGIRFADEAETANALVAPLRARGADTIVLLMHEGGYPMPETDPNGCDGLTGPIREIVPRLDPAIQVVVSGHTHKAYVCDFARYDPAHPVLLTSAGKYGTLVTDITLAFDPVTKRLTGRTARNVIVESGGRAPDARVAALVDRYAAAAAPLARRVVGRMTRGVPFPRTGVIESELGNLIADAQLAATRASGVEIAFMNPGGIRAKLAPAADGTVTFGDVYAVQPFGNVLMVREYTGAQIRSVLEQQFVVGGGPTMLSVAGLRYRFDRSRAAGRRVFDVMAGGRPLDDVRTYRVAISNFLAFGGDGFSAFAAGRDLGDGPTDLDALEAYLSGATSLAPPGLGRVVDRTPGAAPVR